MPKESATESSSTTTRPNVFDFLEDNSHDESSSEGAEEKQQTPRPKTANTGARIRQPSYPSESSARASSPEHVFSVTSRRESASSGLEPPSPLDRRPLAASKSKGRTSSPPPLHHHPEAFYYLPPHHAHVPPRRPLDDDDDDDEDTMPPPPPRHNRSTARPAPPPIAGYAHLAYKLDSSAPQSHRLPPLYRRFEAINHRVLLHLQDEIAQMEEELEMLDRQDTEQRVAAAADQRQKPAAASRRSDLEFGPYSELHARRTALMERLTFKVAQYSAFPSRFSFFSLSHLHWVESVNWWFDTDDALLKYAQVRQSLPKATAGQIHAYRAWLRDHAPIIPREEARFLDHEADLVVLNSNGSGAAVSGSGLVCFVVGVLVAGFLLPLLAY